MPRHTAGSIYKTATGYGIRWQADGRRHHRAGFRTKTEARRWFAENVAPRLDRGGPVPAELTLAEVVELYLERHVVGVRRRTIDTLRDRLRHAIAAFGDEPLRALERMADEIAGWQAKLPVRARHGIVQALRQVLDAAVRWGHIDVNPAKLAAPNPNPLRGRCAPTAAPSWRRSPRSCIRAGARYRSSPPRPAFGRRSGRRPSARTSTAAPVC
jgi:hypothetical protein